MKMINLQRLFWFIFVFVCVLYPGQVKAQNYTIKTYTVADGLAHNTIRSIVRDSTGFLWIGTWDGLSRFDGYEFKNYYHIPGDSTSLPYFSVYWLTVDGNNELWIVSDIGHLIKYNRNTDNFSVIKRLANTDLDFVYHIDKDSSGCLLVLSRNKLIKWNSRTNSGNVTFLKNQKSGSFNFESRVFAFSLKNEELWTSGFSVMKFIRSGNDEMTLSAEYHVKIDPITTAPDIDNKGWQKLYILQSGKKLLISHLGIFRFDEKQCIFLKKNTNQLSEENNVKEASFLNLWNNLISSNYNDKKGYDRKPEKVLGATLSDQNSFWFSDYSEGGASSGLNHLVFTPKGFNNIMLNNSDSRPSAVYSIASDMKGDILVGSRDNKNILEYSKSGKVRSLNQLTDELFARTHHIRTMIQQNDGIWIGYYRDLIQFYDYTTGKFSNFFPDTRDCRTIAVKGSNLYIGTTNLYLFTPVTGKTKIIWESKGNDAIYRLFFDHDSILWGTMAGSKVLRFDTDTGIGTIINLRIGRCNIEDVIEGNKNELWLALLGEGVCRYNIKTGNCKFYTTASGLSNNTTYCLLRDGTGRIWVSTNRGISVINTSNDQIKVYGNADGLNISEFNSGAKYITNEGEFLFGGMGGFVRFYPDSMDLNTVSLQETKIMITDLSVSGSYKETEKDINETDTLILGKGENNVHLSFASSDFISSGKTMYRYRMEGIDKEWIETYPRNRNVNYSNLNPGYYRLILQSTGPNGDWINERTINIGIMPFFYQTWLFRIAVPLILLSLALVLILIYISHIREKSKRIGNELRLQSLQGQMNPHFIFNSLNSINYFISNNDAVSANSYIADFARLIRSILHNMGENFIPLSEEISSIKNYMGIEHLRFGDKFDYVLDTSGITDLMKKEVHPGLIQPFIENAIWHGVRPLENRKGFIRVIFSTTRKGKIICIVEDDGIGINAGSGFRSGRSHSSRGISIIQERLGILGRITGENYSLEINDLHPGFNEPGTQVKIDIPEKI